MNLDYNQLLALATEYGIPLLKALAILVVGWVVAKIFSWGALKVLGKTEIDNKIAAMISRGKTDGIDIETGISKFVYWLILLFVFMAAFQSLGLTIITEPLNALVTKITTFIPQILAAVALSVIAWLVATVLRTVVTNLLSAFNVDDKLSASAGEETKAVSLSKTLGDAVYYLIFLLFLPQILDALQMEGLSPVKEMVGEILGFLPRIFGALLIFAIFYLVARIVQRLATNLLASIGFDNLPKILGFSGEKEDGTKASTIAGYVILTVLLFMGSVQAFNTLGLEIVSTLANELLQGLFNILVACVIFAIGLFLSRIAHDAIAGSGGQQSQVLALAARVAILIFTGAMALYRTDLAPEIVNLAFGALLIGVGLSLGLAFGLGGREAAAATIEGWRSKSSGESQGD